MLKQSFPTLGAVVSWFRRRRSSSSPSFRALRRFDAGLLYRQTASMLRSGIPLSQAVGFLVEEFRPSVAGRLDEVRLRLESGEPLSVATGQLPGSWVSREDRAALAAGERCGRLPDVLESLAEDRERWNAFRDRIRGVLAYPATVLVLSVLVVTIILWKVVPTLAALHTALGARLPPETRFVMATGNFLASWALFIAVAWIAWHFWGRSRILPHLPVVRGLRRSLAELRFARLLSLLLSSGVPLDESLELCEAGAGEPEEARQLKDVAGRVRSGEKPSEALSGLEFVSPVFLWFLAGSEERGDFVAVTRAMADTAEERYLAALDLAQRIAEPLSILFLGLVVGTVVVAVYSPMFRLSSLVGY